MMGTARAAVAVFAFFVALVALAAPASAQVLERFSVRAEGGAGTMLSSYQRDTLGYGLSLLGAVRLGVRPFAPLVFQLSYEGWMFPADDRTGRVASFTGGVRLEPRVGTIGVAYADVNFGLGISGEDDRATLSGAIGFELGIGAAIGFGPFLRYGHAFATADDHPSDAQYLAAGLSLALRSSERDPPANEADTDADGVLDAQDLCVTVPAGPTPDPQRPGCPLLDGDGDGIVDRDDVCPAIPQGATPDPSRRGCPAADTDGDGVFDHEDPCPTTPQGPTPDPRRRGCPDGDDDGDTIRNSADVCPAQHQGPTPDPDRLGCPRPDRDNDAVPDAVDACPDEPGAPHPEPRRNGCPGLVRVEAGQIRILQPVFFAPNRDRILSRSRPVLQAVADALRASPHIRRVSIDGHTDDVAADDYNLQLSQRRANNVMAALIQLGVEAGRLEAHGYGETRPLVRDTTEDARAVNRRVEFNILDPAQPSADPAPAPTPAPSGAGMRTE